MALLHLLRLIQMDTGALLVMIGILTGASALDNSPQ
jgi:hypothetical protein